MSQTPPPPTTTTTTTIPRPCTANPKPPQPTPAGQSPVHTLLFPAKYAVVFTFGPWQAQIIRRELDRVMVVSPTTLAHPARHHTKFWFSCNTFVDTRAR